MLLLPKNTVVLILVLLTACVAAFVGGCASDGNRDSAPKNIKIDLNAISNAVPKDMPVSKYGNPSSYSVRGKTYYTLKTNQGFQQKGDASWYGTKFHGRRTSSGETYDMYAMTAAHKTLPIPSYVKVINLDNNKEIVVKVNDRGPFHAGRIIDLSYVAALKLDIVKTGTGRVKIESIGHASRQKVKPKQVFVQVGAFHVKDNAQQIHDKLAAASIESDIDKVIVSAKKHIYRVRIGPFKKRNDAGNMLKSLEDLGVSNAKVFSGYSIKSGE